MFGGIWITIAGLLLAYTTRSGNGINVTLGVLLPYHPPPSVLDACPTLRSVEAEEGIIRKHMTNYAPDINLSVSYHNTCCSDYDGPIRAMEIFYRNSVNILYGPCCKFTLSPVGRYAKHWKLPIVTPGGLTRAFGNRDNFPYLTRLTGSYAKLAHFVKSNILEEYKWTNLGVIWHENLENETLGRSDCGFRSTAIRELLRKPDSSDSTADSKPSKSKYDKLVAEVYDQTSVSKYDWPYILNNVRLATRVVIFCGSSDSVREILIRAAEMNFDNGEYVFINIDLFGGEEKPWFKSNDTEERNAVARRMYEYVLTVTLRKPDSAQYRSFSEKVKDEARQKFNVTIDSNVEVNSFVGSFHDAVMLYALALNDTVAAGFNATDGPEITKRMRNRTFEGITGTVSIDEFGDRNADYSLLDMNATGSFEVVANYYGSARTYNTVGVIRWGTANGRPPENDPTCGFDGSKCKKIEPHEIVIIVLGILLVIVSATAFFVYRHYKLEAELAEENWRVRWEDIMFGAQEKRRLERSGSLASFARRGSAVSLVSVDTIAYHLSNIGSKQIFTKTGSYKATLVAIKKINKTVTITKPLLVQIRKLRVLQNDHIAHFVGICIDSPNQCVLTEYCQKGSLQDVLENDQIKLDSMFKFSLIQDIVRGMAYLHSSDIRSHGNIKSSNCVVDSRFVLKVTDFGLPTLRGPNDISPDDVYVYYRYKLWTAPELLRCHSRPPEGTQKGDVYSFAIICQEIIYRNGPFWVENMELSPEEIYRLVKNGQKPFFRPTLHDSSGDDKGLATSSDDDLAAMVRRCWSEDPLERPDFHSLKTIIKRINKDGDCGGNLLDNLLSRMEQYAYNLEALVEERTADYLQQKKRAEDLLYMMLPRSVAVQLMQGETVQAEKFECVTIYFSDICDFTALSSDSTPMQVVDLLNDLYTTFDSIIGLFDVYKVETIGDAYFIVSGLPVRNGTLHVREIARAALTLLNAVKSFKIRHRPLEQLKLRIGIHSGPVCAGIVGMKMPRYCLIGDTVNTASRMESNGEPLKIHVSSRTKELLDSFSSFVLELRGSVPMKGKGELITWWLQGEINPDFPELAPPVSIDSKIDNNFKIF